MNSIWTQTADIHKRESLEGEIHTEVLIIGGGMAGILCAQRLRQAGISYVLAEANTICSGVTKNTTAKITSQHGLIYHKLIKQFGVERAQMYLYANEAAIRQYRELAKEIDCDFEDKDAFVYSLNDLKKLEDELAALEKLHFNGEFVKDIPLPLTIAGAVKFPNQAQFNPLKLVAALADDLNIYENTRVTQLTQHGAQTQQGTIYAKKIIVASHFPFINKHGSYFLKQYQHRSYVIALENAPEVGGMYVDEAQKGMSFRNYKNLLLVGGGDHRTGKQGGNWQELTDFSGRNFPDAREVLRWSTQDCMSLDGVPYIGQYSKNTPNLYVATGFNKWGMTTSMVAANLLTDLILEKSNSVAEVFSPSRSILRPQLAANALEATLSLVTPTAPRCPHMGCALKWNKQERSWDCPCHGSRFTKDGGLLDNPATGDLKKKP